MRSQSYVSAARRIAELASHVEDLAGASAPREQASRTRAIHALLQAARRLQRRNANRTLSAGTIGDEMQAAGPLPQADVRP